MEDYSELSIKVMALSIFARIIERTNHVFKELEERRYINENRFNEFVIERSLLNIHIADRIIFSDFGSDIRDIYIACLSLNILDILLEQFMKKKLRKAFSEYYYALYNERQTEYSRFRAIIPDEMNDINETALWFFAKNISVELGHSSDIETITIIVASVLKDAYDVKLEIDEYLAHLFT